MNTLADCPLCRGMEESVLWRNEQLRVISVNDSAHPGFTRVIWQDHVSEMTQLAAAQRHDFMQAVFTVEQVQREVLRPDKVNLAQLGNVVPHLHWHVIPRWKADSHFPEPVWAASPPRDSAAQKAWQEQNAHIQTLLEPYHAALKNALSRPWKARH